MNAASIGALIAKLRKKHNMTQAELAEKLNISNKAVSRWESGLGYPEITQFPILASVFGVTVDYLMTGERKGITIAGNIIVDIVKQVDCYPERSMLANITEVNQAVGGCVPNTTIDLAKIDPSLPLSVMGKIGDDEQGRFLLSQLNKYGIDCEGICLSDKKPTSFSDVISEPSGERTFLHARGANAEFCPDDIDLASLNCHILHIGYILLLDAFDKEDEEYGTVMARFLHSVQQKGVKTSVDVVSDSTGRYKEKILPALKYCNYIILNETESSMLSDLPPYDENGNLIIENIRATMEFMASHGVKDKIIVHCKKAGFCYDVATKNFTVCPSLNIPKEKIKGSVGAGDAFCAGSLYGIYNNFDDMHILEFAASAAACNLFAENSIDGMKSKNEVEKMPLEFGWQKL